MYLNLTILKDIEKTWFVYWKGHGLLAIKTNSSGLSASVMSRLMFPVPFTIGVLMQLSQNRYQDFLQGFFRGQKVHISQKNSWLVRE